MCLWLVVWTLIIAGLLISDIIHIRRWNREMAESEARIHLNKDLATRLWASSHGGVYVPVTETTPSNPYLSHVPDRDIQTREGKKLTLMNPAYMLRQVMRHYEGLYGTRGHITSLKFFRKETEPDPWEEECLRSFERGVPEVSEVAEIRGKPYLRFMRPIRTEADCLKCHGYQGYRVGDVRGGISVSVPLARFLENEREEIRFHTFSFLSLWVLGIAGIGFTAHRIIRRTKERDKAEDLLRRSERKYVNVVQNSLTGIYLNIEGKLAFVNRRLADIFGYSPEEMIGMDYLALVHPEDREHVAEFREKRLAGLDVPSEYETRGITKGGATLWIRRRNALTEFDGKVAILSNIEDVTERKLSAEKLERSEKMLRNLSSRLLYAQEEERKKVAFEIHEGLAQAMSAVKFRVESVLTGEGLTDRETLRVVHALGPAIDILQDSIGKVRQIANRLRPMVLDDLGLIPAVHWLFRQTQRDYPNLSIESNLEVPEDEIPSSMKLVIYRVLERAVEALPRLEKAEFVEICLKRVENTITLTLWSDAIGLVEQESAEGEALATIRERCMLSGASFSLTSDEKEGTTIQMTWPLESS